MKAMLRIQHRRRAENKETRFIRYGREVPPEKLYRFMKRHKIENLEDSELLSDGQVSTPSDISYRTPDPETPMNTFAPTADDSSRTASVSERADNETEENTAAVAGNHSTGLRSYGPYQTYSHPLSSPTECRSGDVMVSDSPQLRSPSASGSPRTHRSVMTNHESDGPAFSPDLSFTFDFFSPAVSTFSPLESPLTNDFLVSNSNWSSNNLHKYDDVIATAQIANPTLHGSRGLRHFGYQGSHSEPVVTKYWVCGSTSMQEIPHKTSHATDTVSYISNDPNGHMANYTNYCGAQLAESMEHCEVLVEDPSACGTSIDRLHFLRHTPLHSAVINGNINVTRALLEHGADPSPAASGALTPLHYAAIQGNLELVYLLKNGGADIDAVTDDGQSVLFFTVCNQHRLESIGKALYHNPKWWPPPGRGGDENILKVIEALFNSPPGWTRLLQSLSWADKAGVTPLMAAAEAGLARTATLFLQHGAQPDTRDHVGHTAIRYAASCKRNELVRLLLWADKRVQAQDLSHMLNLASWNLAARPDFGNVGHMPPYLDLWWKINYESALIADEMVRLYREMGVLEKLIALARREGLANVIVYFEIAMGET
ncbi:ankyrin repeat-containing domain protein [Bombardia bombarda]|uniref:Ankyrin repeat-containing domain protein n=1 Tax=Bombardia bombarda TaxID=252184 RepID=A0AA39W3U7_9PEZI|nr:ankyrin repeat-containing domain protein [Bombardia bombarda]